MKKFILGFITGGIICAAVTGFAVEYAVTANPYPVKVNGSETAIEGYNINDNTYFKLRDVADAVGGFEVGFSDNTITINTETVSEPTDAPAAAVTSTPLNSQGLPLFTSDGLRITYVENVPFVNKAGIENKMEYMRITDYVFATNSLMNNVTLKTVLTDIPTSETSTSLIPLDYYNSTLLPFLNSLKAAE